MHAIALRRPHEKPLDLLHAVALSKGTPMAYLSWPGGRCLWATSAYAQLLEMQSPELTGKTPSSYLVHCHWIEWERELERLAQTGSHGASLEVALPYGPSQRIPTQLVAHCAGEQVCGVVVAPLQDVSFTHAMQMVQDSDNRMRRYAKATREAIIFFQHEKIFDANPAALTLSGYPLAQLLEQPVQHLLPHALRADAAHAWQHGAICTLETRLLCHSGQELDVEINIYPQHEAGDEFGLLVLRDISARKRAEAEIHFLAFNDPLTRLPNRQGLLRQLRHTVQQAAQHHHTCVLLYVDLDRFKDVNDSLGHDAGDKLLIETARRLRSKVHPDDLIARLGSDEFVVVLASPHNAQQCECILGEIRFALSKGYVLPHGLVHLPASIGVSRFPEDGNSAEELLLNASAAMEAAKRLGQGDVQHYSTLMDMRPSRLLSQDRLLREAVDKDSLVLHYQPQWDLSTDGLEGFEALVRWQHPERGLLLPGEFIAFAEARGLICLIDRWVMRAACKQLRAWRDAGLPPVVVSVNMSPIEFNQHNLASEVQQALTDTGVDPRWLEIELTETTLMKQSEHVLSTLTDLQKLGVRLSIDDFGTGYSSLAYLKRYPLDKIKIDRSFIKDTPEDADDVSIITAIIQMAHSLNLRTVAEGVETQAQWNLLKTMGCDLIQGYYLSRPMPADEALRWQQQRCHTAAPQ